MFTRTSGAVVIVFFLEVQCLGTLIEPASSTEPTSSVSLRIEVDLPAGDLVIGQNPSVTVSIYNTSDEDVILPNVIFDYNCPTIYLERRDTSPVRLWYGSQSINKKKNLLISAGSKREYTRLLYEYFQPNRWPVAIGEVLLYAEIDCEYASAMSNLPQRRINWVAPRTKVTVRARTTEEKQAWFFLANAHKKQEADLSSGKLKPDEIDDQRIDIFEQFLNRYSDTPYAAEIRWELAQTLLLRIENNQIPSGKLEQRERLLQASLRWCLDTGAPYAGTFIADSTLNTLISYAQKRNDKQTMLKAATAIRSQHPNHRDAVLFATMLEAIADGKTQPFNNAQIELRNRHPNSPFLQVANRLKATKKDR